MRYRPSTAALAQLTELINAGSIKTTVTKTFSLAQAQDAWKYARSGHAHGKIVRGDLICLVWTM
jgi:NADPH:quinone reductase-like Zn-dependent oxidoreductase